MKKKLFAILLVTLLLVTCLCACNKDNDQTTTSDNDKTITIFVGLGNGESYYNALADIIKKEYPEIEFRFVYHRTYNTSGLAKLEFKNNDLPADIMITSSMTESDLLINSCLNIQNISTITNLFSNQKLNEYKSDDGGIYQLPYTSKMLGITYNKTLLQEMMQVDPSIKVPTTYAEMIELKQKCETMGITFAVTDDTYSGNGFNYLFNLMGAKWISSPAGIEWFNAFKSGKIKSADELKNASSYFKDWCDNGLFGTIITTGSSPIETYKNERALFYYSLNNNVSCFERDDGNGGKTTDYLSAIPWLTENPNASYFVAEDTMYVSLNKKMEGNQDKIDNCLKILKLMTTDEVVNLYTNLNKDGYIAKKNFQASEGCMFSDYISKINAGYVIPWYYNYFSDDVHNPVGNAINSYITGNSTDFNNIFSELETSVENSLNPSITTSDVEIMETLSYADVAKIACIAGAKTAQAAMDNASIDGEVTVGLMSYVNDIKDLVPFNGVLGAINSKLYKGEFDYNSYVGTLYPSNGNRHIAVKLTGKEIKDLVAAGWSRAGEAGYDYDASVYAPYPIMYVTKGGFELQDNQTYIVAANVVLFKTDYYNKLVEDGKVLTNVKSRAEKDFSDNRFKEEVISYLKSIKKVYSSSLKWN